MVADDSRTLSFWPHFCRVIFKLIHILTLSSCSRQLVAGRQYELEYFRIHDQWTPFSNGKYLDRK